MPGQEFRTRLKLAGLAIAGICLVSVPLTVAVVMSATGASDVLTLGDIEQARQQPPTVATRCAARRGHYALTFDDGPFPATTPRLVAALERSGAVATFFDVGARARAHPRLVVRQGSVGQVANHGYSHPDMAEVSEARRLQELRATAQLLGYPNALFRPPNGEMSPAVRSDVRRTGLTLVLWTVDVYDPSLTADEIVARALQVRPGGIIRLGEGLESTVEALPDVVDGLRRRGMCPGYVAPTRAEITASNGATFNAIAVKP